MIGSIVRDKIPSKYAFVLKTGQLENMLTDNDIDIYIDLIYWFPQQIGSIFEANFWLPNDHIAYNRLYIRAGALLKEDIFLAREKMAETVLPEFVVWIKNVLALPINSPQLGHNLYFNAVLQNKELKLVQ